MIPTARANAMLDTEFVDGDKMSLHSAYSTSGANELSGGSYARQTLDFNAASNRSKASNGAVPDFPVPAGATVAFVGVWDTGGSTFKGMYPNGGSEKSYQVDLTNNRIYCEGHGMVDNDRVVFMGATVPTGLTAGTIYHVVGTTAGDPDYFQVSATQGGGAIDISGQPSADSRVSKVVVEAYAGAGTHRITAFAINL
jgi:hypothetical protein